jgi:DNA ligase-1
MDGVRAYWNGTRLISRHGKPFICPIWFVETLPPISLDGELWMGRGTLDNLMMLLNSRNHIDITWKSVKLMAFDLPNSTEQYEYRQEIIRSLQLPPHVVPVDVQECKGYEHLRNVLEEFVRNGGEGLMLSKPRSLYVGGRTSYLLKVKVFLFVIQITNS